GVTDAGVNFANQDAWISYDPIKTNAPMLQKAVQSIGYNLVITKENRVELKEEAQQKLLQSIRQRFYGAFILSLPVVVIAMFFMN
ncbi:hypothetical protein, partial [Raoultella planticola]|uniref:hypothetical protein n=1 Tax=Raoultella planticola TaxID=575 RepID=UPI001954FB75